MLHTMFYYLASRINRRYLNHHLFVATIIKKTNFIFLISFFGELSF